MTMMWKACLLFAACQQIAAFSPVAFGSRRSLQSSTSETLTTLYISGWGEKGPPSRWADATSTENPATKIQSYLPPPGAVEARANVDGTVLVSGLVRQKERTDQFIFDLLNDEESAFEFSKIVAFVDDAKFANKRLLSRSARYSGLLDKLEFIQAVQPGALPNASQLDGVKSWIAVLEDDPNMLETCKQVAAVAKSAPSVENVAILLTGANELDVAACKQVVADLQGNDKQSYTLLAVGKVGEHAEGKVPYQYREFGTAEGTIPAGAVYSRDESLRMITELLQLECGVNTAYAFAEVHNGNQTEAKLIKGLREAGYARPQEIDHMMRDGPQVSTVLTSQYGYTCSRLWSCCVDCGLWTRTVEFVGWFFCFSFCPHFVSHIAHVTFVIEQNYKKAVEDFKTKNPDAAAGFTNDIWWEGEQFQQSRRKSAEREVAKEQSVKDERTMEIEEVAKEWARREFFRQSMSGQVDAEMTEEDFIKSIWDRALFEGDLKYRQMKGEKIDDVTELADFKTQQERKQKAMLTRAKKEMKEILQEDNLGGDDVTTKLLTEDETDDDDDDDDDE